MKIIEIKTRTVDCDGVYESNSTMRAEKYTYNNFTSVNCSVAKKNWIPCIVVDKDAHSGGYVACEAGSYKEPTSDFIDGKTYDGTKPNEYIQSFEIGLK